MSAGIWSTRSYCDISQHTTLPLCHHWRSLYWCTNRVGYRLPFGRQTLSSLATDGLSRLYFGLHLPGVLEAGPVRLGCGHRA